MGKYRISNNVLCYKYPSDTNRDMLQNALKSNAVVKQKPKISNLKTIYCWKSKKYSVLLEGCQCENQKEPLK